MQLAFQCNFVESLNGGFEIGIVELVVGDGLFRGVCPVVGPCTVRGHVLNQKACSAVFEGVFGAFGLLVEHGGELFAVISSLGDGLGYRSGMFDGHSRGCRDKKQQDT